MTTVTYVKCDNENCAETKDDKIRIGGTDSWVKVSVNHENYDFCSIECAQTFINNFALPHYSIEFIPSEAKV